MTRSYVQHLILSATVIFALEGCVHKPSKAVKVDPPIEASSPPPQQMVLLQEARLEAENLRAELARLKILMAKQAGELHTLRNQAETVRQREDERGQELQNIRSQLMSSQAERDQLRKHNMELEGQVASMPDTSQLVTDIQSLRSSFRQILTNMKGLVSDITLIKQEMHITSKKLKPRQTKLVPTPGEQALDNRIPDANGRIVIQYGDTLWELARTFRASVSQLKEWNDLTSDLIVTGNQLKVAKPGQKIEAQSQHVKAPSKLGSHTLKSAIQQNQDTGPAPQVDTEITPSSETTHILSIGGPESESHESP